MSLLLEALKKAELAKQSSLGSAQGGEPDLGGLRFEEPAGTTSPSEPIEDFLAPVQAAPALRTSAEPAASAPRSPRPAPPAEPEATTVQTPDPQRAAARQLFDAKEVDYNPKRPFYITLGVLGLCAVGYGVYLWWQLQPRATVNTTAIQNAPKSAPVTRSALPPPPSEGEPTPSPESARNTAAAEGSPAPASTQTQEVPAGKPAAISAAPAAAPPGTLTTAKPASVAPAAIAPTPSTFLRQGQGTPAAKPAATAPAVATSTAPEPNSAVPPRPAAPRAPRLPIKVTPPALQINDVLESAYAAFQRGELDRARTEYQLVLGREPTSRDALLGLAAIDMRTRDYATAELRYLKILELDPRDSYAYAALISMQGNVDPVQSESRIKNLIAAQPEATHLYFTLGNQYAAQARWSEAQSAYFKAFNAEPDNADFAFNLAVSLDHLRQPRLAGEYYRKAVNLAGSRPVGFDRQRAESRARELER